MSRSKNPKSGSHVLQAIDQALGSNPGSVMVYLIVVILIFGVLGVTIVSLFTTATTSSATPNDARRAAYVTESALRYAFSELRNSGFATGVVNSLNTTTYTLDNEDSFSLNVFGPWFKAGETKTIGLGETGTIKLKVQAGKLPATWAANGPGDLWVINYDYLDLSLETTRNGVDSWTQLDDTTLEITVTSDFFVNKGERVCLFVKLSASQTLNDGGDLYVNKSARNFFPAYGGAININGIDYVYKRLVYDPDNDRVKLETVSEADMPNTESASASAFPLDLSIHTAFIVLSPRNYFVIPTGTADTVSVAGTFDKAVGIYDTATVKPLTRNPDISLDQYKLAKEDEEDEQEADPDLNAIGTAGFISTDNSTKTIDIGSGLNSGSADFGGLWFDTDATIGGKVDVCSSAGECEFGRGVRVFFTLDYDGTADGLTFALINASHNTTSSIGGDINAGELLGYAGDSRTVADPTEPASADDFLDSAGASQIPPNPGLHPPKIALEFDTYNNIPHRAYCDAGSIRDNNRNDPFSVERGQDALQFVFWARTGLTMSCRDYTISGSPRITNHPTYDDNRHDIGQQTLKWTHAVDIWNSIRSTPALSSDGSTVYVGSNDHFFYALHTADGTAKWWFGTGGDVRSSPVVGPDGMVYVGSHWGDAHGRVYAFNPKARLLQPKPAGGTLNTSAAYKEWVFYTPNNVNSSPAIGADGKIYIGDDGGNFYALNPEDRWEDSKDNNPDNDTLTANEWKIEGSGIGLKKTSLGRPAIGPAPDVNPVRERIYIASSETGDNKLFALNPADGSIEWTYDKSESSRYMPAADPVTGVVYSEKSGGQIVALSFNGTTVNTEWNQIIGTDHFTPVVKNGSVYAAGIAGSSAGKLTALDSSDGTQIWNFTDSGNLDQVQTTPAIAPDGTIYFASKDGLLYAVDPTGSKKWTFAIPVDENDTEGYSSPAVGNDGVVYIGTSYSVSATDDQLYAINDFVVPRNIKHNYVTSVRVGADDTVGDETVSLDSDIDWLNGADSAGPWAVRLEVIRSLIQNSDSKYEYTLRAWIRQCTTDACANLLGTFYEDTRIQYSVAPHLAQIIELTPAEHSDFATFLFGFTGATGPSKTQTAEITDVKLSFIRFNDPIAP